FGRTMAISSAGLMTVQGLGFAAAGALAQVLSPAFVIAGAGICGLAAVYALRPGRQESFSPRELTAANSAE
ncbi:MAG TPA: hypothetical protein VFI37_15935, partial [Gaiellaceae bacterium]|nr:hypothetical protein [Gaiellaceae bacterium]